MKISVRNKTNHLTIRGENKKPLTLLELFLCVALLVLIGSFVIVKSRPMIDYYQIREGVQRLAKELNWSHKVSMSLSGDIDVLIERRGNILYCERMTDERVKFKGGNQTFKIKQIDQLFFEKEEIPKLKLFFDRSGMIFPKGTLEIKAGGKIYEILLNSSQSHQIYVKET